MNKLKESIMNLLQDGQLTTSAINYIFNHEYSRNEVRCALGHLHAEGLIIKTTDEYWGKRK